MPTKAEMSRVRAQGRAAVEATSTGAILGATTAPVILRAALDAVPTVVSPEVDRAVVGVATVLGGMLIPRKHRALKYGAYASGAVVLGTAIADMLLGPEEDE